MSLYKPFGISSANTIDPDQLEKEFIEAKKIAENTTSWQWLSSNKSRLKYDTIAKNGAGVIVEQRQRAAYLQTDKMNLDGRNINKEALKLKNGLDPWYIPYMRGWHSVWGGELDINWTSSHSELVLIGYSFFVYRLASKDESLTNTANGQWWFSDDVRPRIKFGVKIDGSIIEGSGCGTNVSTNGPEMVWGNGSRQKAIVSSSNSIQMLGSGNHTASPVAAQGPANKTDRNYYYKSDKFLTSPGEGLNGPAHGVAMINARFHIIRFPRGRNFGV